MCMSLQHCTHICMHAATKTNSNIHLLFSFSVPRKGLHASYHGNIASDSNSNNSIACLVVAVVSVIQEQLLRRSMDSDKLPAGGLSLTNPGLACQLSLGPKGRPFILRNHGSSTRHTPAPAQITNLATETTKLCIQFKLTE